jgi:hypothetical protein
VSVGEFTKYGTHVQIQTNYLFNGEKKTDHALRLKGLRPSTRYYYTLGYSSNRWITPSTSDYSFVTPPTAGEYKPTRVWVLGDSGTGNEIQRAHLEAYSDYGQNLFDRYVAYADHWLDEIDFKDPDTGALWDRASLNEELEKIEKPAGLANPKDFRQEVVKYVLRQKAAGNPVPWTSYEKLRKVIEKKMFASTEDLIPIISFGSKASKDDQKKHDDFVSRMVEKGYTSKQVRRIVEWYLRVRKSG